MRPETIKMTFSYSEILPLIDCVRGTRDGMIAELKIYQEMVDIGYGREGIFRKIAALKSGIITCEKALQTTMKPEGS